MPFTGTFFKLMEQSVELNDWLKFCFLELSNVAFFTIAEGLVYWSLIVMG
jgi:hypothetical protein